MTTPAPAALLAFLRGLERRARTLAQAQCGDADRAGLIWTETAAAFPAEADGLPVAAWPVRFWARLLAHPGMAVVDASASPLAALGPGPRAALLLRLVAGLDPRPAADVLGVSEPTYRYALQRGLEQARAAGIDADALQALRGNWQRAPAPSTPSPVDFAAAPTPIRVAPAPALVETIAPVTPPASVVDFAPPPVASPGRRFRMATLALAALAVAAVVSLGWWMRSPAPAPLPPPVAVSAEPPDKPTELSPVTHPDYALIAEAGDAALADDLDLLSWLAAGADAPQAEPTAEAATP